uniref:Uncharacterized protein n=1 Tax=Salix viminalis TaxID=40686 RepID=A0A6N2LFU1_SALVM
MGSDNNNNNVINRKDYILLKDFRRKLKLKVKRIFLFLFGFILSTPPPQHFLLQSSNRFTLILAAMLLFLF